MSTEPTRESLLAPYLEVAPPKACATRMDPHFEARERHGVHVLYQHLVWVIWIPGDEVVLRFLATR